MQMKCGEGRGLWAKYRSKAEEWQIVASSGTHTGQPIMFNTRDLQRL
jgi:hypothetical protein